MAQFSKTADGFHPPEDFLDAFARADVVAFVACRASINGRAFALLGNVRGDSEAATGIDEGSGVVAHVRGESGAPPMELLQHFKSRLVLAASRHRAHVRLHDQLIPAFRKKVSGSEEFGLLAFCLAGEPRIRIRRGSMRSIGAPLPVEIHLWISPSTGRILRRLAFGAKAFERGPRF